MAYENEAMIGWAGELAGDYKYDLKYGFWLDFVAYHKIRRR